LERYCSNLYEKLTLIGYDGKFFVRAFTKKITKNGKRTVKIKNYHNFFKTGTFWISGLVLFCGSMYKIYIVKLFYIKNQNFTLFFRYYHALTKDNRWRKLTPYGG
jgi:hypothetical protein